MTLVSIIFASLICTKPVNAIEGRIVSIIPNLPIYLSRPSVVGGKLLQSNASPLPRQAALAPQAKPLNFAHPAIGSAQQGQPKAMAGADREKKTGEGSKVEAEREFANLTGESRGTDSPDLVMPAATTDIVPAQSLPKENLMRTTKTARGNSKDSMGSNDGLSHNSGIIESFTGAQAPDKVLREVLALQSRLIVDRRSKSIDKGFLISAFDLKELKSLLKKDGRLYTYRSNAALSGYLLVTNVRKFTDLLADEKQARLLASEKVSYSKLRYLYQIAVDLAQAGQGIGSRLLEKAQRHARSGLLTDVLTHPISNDPSLKFFAKHGFKKIGILELGAYRTFGKLKSEVLLWKP